MLLDSGSVFKRGKPEETVIEAFWPVASFRVVAKWEASASIKNSQQDLQPLRRQREAQGR